MRRTVFGVVHILHVFYSIPKNRNNHYLLKAPPGPMKQISENGIELASVLMTCPCRTTM